jgi:anaerobic magnesium-protoporphyrin IX monomethyl ester cyclase
VAMDLLLTHGYFLEADPQERRIMKPYPPLGLLYISSHLKARGFHVGVFDSTFRSFSEFVACLQAERPSVVGLYCNLMTKQTVLRMAAECRRAGAVVVLGGPEPPSYASEYLERGADFVVVGEGERTLEELLPRLLARPDDRDLAAVAGLVYRDGDGKEIHTAPRPLIAALDAQPLPDREAIDVESYLNAWRQHHGMGSVSLLTARGCPYTCRWCSRSVFGETHRRRSVEAVADEVALIRDRYRPDMLWYVDDVFTIHKGWTLRYAAELERRSLRVPFECISRAEGIDDDVADALRSLGCLRLWIGSESGSQRILDAMDRRVKVEQVREATRRLKQRGIQVGMFIMLGYEGEETPDLAATVDHLKKADPDVFLSTVSYPIKGTPYYDEVEARLQSAGPWEAGTDRDLVVRGRHTPRYYRFAQKWMTAEVARHRHWRDGRYLAAARAAASAGVGRLGMALVERERVS